MCGPISGFPILLIEAHFFLVDMYSLLIKIFKNTGFPTPSFGFLS